MRSLGGRHLAGPPGAKHSKADRVGLADLLAKFDAYAESSRLRFGVPGMAIAVIQGKTTVFSKDTARACRASRRRSITSTVFQIGSISKSFTATVMGSLVDEGKAAFEDHVIDRYPSFQMYDPWVTREFMIWDLMAQHSGMAPYAGRQRGHDWVHAAGLRQRTAPPEARLQLSVGVRVRQ